MKFNLNLLYNDVQDEAHFEGEIPYNKERLSEFGIENLDATFEMDLYKVIDDIRVNLYYEGVMYSENGSKKFENALDEDLLFLLDKENIEILDIYEFLWQNIILEVPLDSGF